jgi:hypothetical protein
LCFQRIPTSPTSHPAWLCFFFFMVSLPSNSLHHLLTRWVCCFLLLASTAPPGWRSSSVVCPKHLQGCYHIIDTPWMKSGPVHICLFPWVVICCSNPRSSIHPSSTKENRHGVNAWSTALARKLMVTSRR